MSSAPVSKLSDAASRLAVRMKQVDIANAPVSDYTKRYYKDYLRKLDYALSSIVQLLDAGLQQCGKEPEQITIIDHGGGIGIISFLAAEAGFGNVIYSDIFRPAAEDATRLAELLKVKISHFHAGELTTLPAEMESKGLKADLLVSRNVIEHIYSLNDFFQALKNIPSSKLSIAFSTTANYHNPATVLYTEKLQKKAELTGLKGKWEKETDRGIPFLRVREQIIKENFSDLGSEHTSQLAAATRGMEKKDILRVVEGFKKSGEYPKVTVLRKNTCDPMTGNRTENLIPVSHYRELFHKHGFSFSTSFGLYNENYSSMVLNLATPVLNTLIRKKIFALQLAPFLIFSGRRK